MYNKKRTRKNILKQQSITYQPTRAQKQKQTCEKKKNAPHTKNGGHNQS